MSDETGKSLWQGACVHKCLLLEDIEETLEDDIGEESI